MISQALTDDRFGQVLDSIYDSAVAPEKTGDMLGDLASFFDATFCDYYARTHDRTRGQGIVHGLSVDDYQNGMIDTWANRNAWAQKAPVRAAGEVISTREMVSKPDLMRTDMYNGYLAPRGLHEGLRIAIWSGEIAVEYLSLLRPWSAGMFDRDDVAMGKVLLPHLQRAAMVRRKLQAAELATRAGLAALDTLHHPVMLLDQGATPRYLNIAAHTLLRQEDGLCLQAGRLAAATPALTNRLESALRRAAGVQGKAVAVTVRLDRPSGGTALSLVAMPLHWDGAWMQQGHPAIMVCVSGPGMQGTAPADGEWSHLVELFGLTAAEVALAAALLSGEDLTGIATKTGRSVATMRTHLARLMAKTDTSRQSELMRLLLSVPRV